MCRSLQITCVHIESDSALVVQMIRQGKLDNWRFYYIVSECLHSLLPGYHIDHVYKQKNMVADRLAVWAHEHNDHLDIYCIEDCPQMVRTAHVAGKLGL